MKRLAVLSTVLLLSAGVTLAAESGSIPTSEIPEVKEVTGKGNQVLETTFFPIITAEEGDPVDSDCAAFLQSLANKPISKTDVKRIRRTRDGDAIKTDLIGLEPIPLQDLITTVNILPAHKKTAKILVFWTVRVVGQCVPWRIKDDLCLKFTYEPQFTCIANDVKTYVSVNGVIKTDNACTLQIPEMTSASNEVKLYDPTITGTYVITKDDFEGGVFPDTVTIQIFWQNKGSLRVTSPSGLRNMIVNVIPYSRVDK